MDKVKNNMGESIVKNKTAAQIDDNLPSSYEPTKKEKKANNKDRKQKSSAQEWLGKLSRGLMLPIALLPIAGLMLGIGAAIESYADTEWIATLGHAIKVPGDIIFGNLPLLFAVAIAITFANDAGPAGLAAVVGWMVFNATQSVFIDPHALEAQALDGGTIMAPYGQISSAMYTQFIDVDNQAIVEYSTMTGKTVEEISDSLAASFTPAMDGTYYFTDVEQFTMVNYVATNSSDIYWLSNPSTTSMTNGNYDIWFYEDLSSSLFTSNDGVFSLSTSVFGGIIIGVGAAWMYNRFHNSELPVAISFFQGVRSVPIMTFFLSIGVGLVALLVWPPIGMAIVWVGTDLLPSIPAGLDAFVYGFTHRALNPFGLHHAFYAPIWFSAAGGSINELTINEWTIEALNNLGVSTDISTPEGQAALDFASQFSTALWLDVQNQLGLAASSIDGDNTMWMNVNSSSIMYFDDHGMNQGIYFEIGAAKEGETALSSWTALLSAPVEVKDAIMANTDWGTDTFIYQDGNVYLQTTHVDPGQYLQGFYPWMIFGLPAAAAAMIMAAPKGNRKVAGSVVIAAALTSFLTGITEPIEFTFLFLAPWLYWGVHCVIVAFGYMFLDIVGTNVGVSFSGGIIDLTVYGFLPFVNGENTQVFWIIALGIAFIPIYYFVFYYCIVGTGKKHAYASVGLARTELGENKQGLADLDQFVERMKKKGKTEEQIEALPFSFKTGIETPGRGDNIATLYTKKDFQAKQAGKLDEQVLEIVVAYGGFDNMPNVVACATKLRVTTKSQEIVDQDRLRKELGAAGTINIGKNAVYAIYGGRADNIKGMINDYRNNPQAVEYVAKRLAEGGNKLVKGTTPKKVAPATKTTPKSTNTTPKPKSK